MRTVKFISSPSFFLENKDLDVFAKVKVPYLRLVQGKYFVVEHFIILGSAEHVHKQSCDGIFCNPEESPF